MCCTPKTNSTLYINYNSVKKTQNPKKKGECKSQQCARTQGEAGCPYHTVPLSLTTDASVKCWGSALKRLRVRMNSYTKTGHKLVPTEVDDGNMLAHCKVVSTTDYI